MRQSGRYPANSSLEGVGRFLPSLFWLHLFFQPPLHDGDIWLEQRGVYAGSHRFGSRAEVMHAAVVQRTAHTLFAHQCHACITWQILHRLLDDVCDTGSIAAAMRPLLGKARQIIVEVFPLPSLLGFWPYCCRLGPVVTPKLQAAKRPPAPL